VKPLSEALAKSARLLKHADFERVYKNGQRHFSAHFMVFYASRSTPVGAGAGSPRIGFTVSRALGGAVVRNRLRRRMREAVRRHLRNLAAPLDVVIHPRKSLLTVRFAQLSTEVERAFAMLAKPAESKAKSRAPRHTGADSLK
jgi:ribonuclease P protein component